MTEAGKAGSLCSGTVPKGGDKSDDASVAGDAMPRTRARTGKSNGLSEQTQMRLGNHLRTMYDSVLQQPVPDRFRDMIARLDAGKPETP